MTKDPESKPKRRWHQFSLKWLLGLVSLCCVGLVAWQEFVKPRLSVQVTPGEKVLVHGRMVDLGTWPMVVVNLLGPNVDMAAMDQPQPDRFGRIKIEFSFSPPTGGWPRGNYRIRMQQRGKLVAERMLVVRATARCTK